MEIYFPLAVAVAFTLLLTIFSIIRARQRDPERPRSVVELPDEVAQRVDALIADGKHVAAVKEVRDATGASLQSGVDVDDGRAPPAARVTPQVTGRRSALPCN